jgi:uncharacterized protein YndB with AHSA1/START domain
MASENSIVIKRVFAASAERVFAAWTQSDLLKQWMGPGPVTVSVAEVDLVVGGAYKLVMNDPEGGTHIPSGTYEEIVANEKLVFSWSWADSDEVTRVTIELREVGNNETELTLTHVGFAATEVRDHHEEGWNGCLDKLATAL